MELLEILKFFIFLKLISKIYLTTIDRPVGLLCTIKVSKIYKLIV